MAAIVSRGRQLAWEKIRLCRVFGQRGGGRRARGEHVRCRLGRPGRWGSSWGWGGSICVRVKLLNLKSTQNPTENMQGPRGARLHVTYGSMAREATANLLHVLLMVLLCLWDILVSEPE